MFNPMNRETLNKFYQRLRDKGIAFEIIKLNKRPKDKIIPFCDLGAMTQRALLEIKKGDK